MILKDKILIDRPPEEVWQYIESPALMQKWNPRIRAFVPVSWGEPSEGYRYRVRYKMISKESNFLAEYMEYQKPVKLLIHLSGGNLPAKGYIQEIYELAENTRGTLLKQRIEIYNSGMHLFSGCGTIFIHFFSRFSRKKHLRLLKDFIETAQKE
ncbi:MAG: SRPBCC family protein [Thermodesulfovibrionales bacterium]